MILLLFISLSIMLALYYFSGRLFIVGMTYCIALVFGDMFCYTAFLEKAEKLNFVKVENGELVFLNEDIKKLAQDNPYRNQIYAKLR